MPNKPSIVFVHGLWADGSCFSKLIPTLQAEGHEVISTQNSLDSLKTDVFSRIEIADGRIWLQPKGTEFFCGDLSPQDQKLVWAVQGVPVPDLFAQKLPGTAWKDKPSWYIVAKNDRTVHPDMERFCAKRMDATTYEADSSHVPMLSKPNIVLQVIRDAAKGVQAGAGTALPSEQHAPH